MTAPLLHMQRIEKRFGGTHALRGVSLEVHAGEVLALIGENGAGKSTLMKILSGALAPDAGTMQFAGAPYHPQGPHAARVAGVAMIYQELNLGPDLSVEDNIMLGQERHRGGLLDRRQQRELVLRALTELGHPDLPLHTPVRQLSVGLQQLVEIARALVADARLIVFDEPTSSLTQHDAERLFAVIAKLKASGRAVIYISHFLEEVRAVADRYTVLRDGESVASGDLKSVTAAQIVSLMVGRSVDELFPVVPHEPGEVLLSVDRLSGVKLPLEASLEVRRGEILGIAGLVGAGRTELLRCLAGLDVVRHGQVRIGVVAPAATPRARLQAGLGLLSEDRKNEGLAQARSIADNLTLSDLKPYTRWGWLSLGKRASAVSRWMERMQIKARSSEQLVSELSGGNQQKVALARLLHQDADVLLLDEPTRGIDVGTKAEIYRQLGELAAAGKAIIFVSSYLPELLAVCDRLAVMSRGRLRKVRPVREWNEESVMACAVASDELGP
ncbi:MAG: sugar ABC transporter ATP-binding protein [Planctomycetaceae bacterium]|nr:sugar ABC transporter ATP-binding protein [Planctomycetaceae bacterium]